MERMGDRRGTRKVFVGRPDVKRPLGRPDVKRPLGRPDVKRPLGRPDVKRPLGRPTHKWEDDIKVDLQEV